MNPILLEFLDHFESERLVIRAPRSGDGVEYLATFNDTHEELKPWMPWAKTAQTLDEAEALMRTMEAKFTTREDLWLHGHLKSTHQLVVCSGLSRIDWTVPKFEIGYWGRTTTCGHGYVTEAVKAIAAFAQHQLKAKRIEIRVDDRNVRSWRVAERAGFPLEAILKNDRRALDGTLSHTRIYAKTF